MSRFQARITVLILLISTLLASDITLNSSQSKNSKISMDNSKLTSKLFTLKKKEKISEEKIET